MEEKPAASATFVPRRRATDTLTTLAIAASVALVLVAAAPAVARAIGFGERPAVAIANPLDLAPAPRRDAPAFRFEDEDEEEEARLHDPARDLHPRPLHLGDPLEHRPAELHGQKARTLRPTALRDAPDGDDVTAVVAAGQPLIILKAQGEWDLVAYQGAETVTMGWAKKSELSVQ